MSDMQNIEIFERWREGMARAASACKELGYFHVAHHLKEMAEIGNKLIESKPLSRQEVLGMIDERIDKKKPTVN